VTVFLGVAPWSNSTASAPRRRQCSTPTSSTGRSTGPANVETDNPDATIHDLAAVLFEGIITAHAFEDGNKRTAVLAVYAFYALNGYAFDLASDFELVHMAVDVATGDANAAKVAFHLEHWVTPLPDDAES
jgi:death-on-curing family protein